jgi:hypothetical protein
MTTNETEISQIEVEAGKKKKNKKKTSNKSTN